MSKAHKFKATAVKNQLRHIEREIQNSSNKDIDRSRTHLNYFLSPQRDISSYSYYKQRKEELYIYGRSDIVHMVGWVVTAPKDLAQEDEANFFLECYRFMENRYGAKNVVSAVVHKDETTPHLHFCFMPVKPDAKHCGEKLCCKELLNQKEMSDFHPALQKHLNDKGIKANVLTGITKAQGGNRTVKEMKRERDRQRAREVVRERRW